VAAALVYFSQAFQPNIVGLGRSVIVVAYYTATPPPTPPSPLSLLHSSSPCGDSCLVLSPASCRPAFLLVIHLTTPQTYNANQTAGARPRRSTWKRLLSGWHLAASHPDWLDWPRDLR
jgi:hypothetical protein